MEEVKKKKIISKRVGVWIVVTCFILMLIVEIILISSIFYITSNCTLNNVYKPLNNSLLVPDNEVSNISICANYSAIKTSLCLNNIFKDIYSYNITLDYEYDNFTTVDKYIRQYGGDCHESATWFSKAARELGKNSKYVDFTIRYDNSTEPRTRYIHAIAIIIDDDAYCVLDQGKVDCFGFKTKEDENNATG